MQTNPLLDSYYRNLRIDIVYPDMLKETLAELVRFTLPAPDGRGFISYARLDETNAPGVIAEQVAHFAKLNLPFDWMICAHDPYPELKQQLEAAGFQLDLDSGDPAAVMGLDLDEAPPELLAPTHLDVRQVERAGGLQEVTQVLETVFGRDFQRLADQLGAHLVIPGYLSVYLGHAESQPVSAGWTYFPQDSLWASLWGGSTIPSQRRRGFYLAVLAARVQEARQRGRRYLVVYAGSESRPILAAHGFRLLTYASSYEWTPPRK